MEPINTQKLDTVLSQPNNSLSTLIAKAQLLMALDKLFKSIIAPEFIDHCQVANYRDNILVIEIDNGAWATRLRYAVPELINKLSMHSEFSRLNEIKTYIRPAAQSPAPAQPRTKLTSEDSELLTSLAEGIENPNLKKALLRLAENTLGRDK